MGAVSAAAFAGAWPSLFICTFNGDASARAAGMADDYYLVCVPGFIVIHTGSEYSIFDGGGFVGQKSFLLK